MRADERPFNAEDKRSVCREIAADMERDASEFDGKPFTGRTVAEYFGNQGAAIAALALIVEEMLPRFYRLPADFPRPEGDPGCNCGGNPQDFEGPLPACPVHGVEQPPFPHLIFPHNLEPCDLCAHTFGDHTLGVASKPAIRACSVMKCNCENFKRWTGAQSGTCAPPPQSLGTGLGFGPTEPKLTRMDELETTHPENLAAMTMKIGELEKELAEARGDSMGRFYITRRNGYSSSPDGYGGLFVNGKVRRAHRLAMALYREFDLESAALVLHRCDTPACVNPDHLFVGDNFANMRDAAAKGRLKNKKLICKRGHLRIPENQRIQHRKGKPDLKACMLCRREKRRAGDWS